MNPDKLLDAIGMLDDRYFEVENKVSIVTWRRRLIILFAAVLVMILSVGTAMAVNLEFRTLIFSVFNIETHEQPPAGDMATLPAEDGAGPTKSSLQELDVINIDGVVHAHYFTSDGIVLTYEGGFYTCSHSDVDTVPEDAAFWEIHRDGIARIDTTRIDFSFTHGNRTLQLIFDYAILNGKLSIKAWPQNLDENPVGNGWSVEPVGNRTDIALLIVPVRTGADYTHDFLLLDLTTLKTTNLLQSISCDNLIIDALWVTNDLHYAVLMGVDKKSGSNGYWFCDLKRNTITTLEALTGKDATEPYFLDNSTIVFKETLGTGQFNIGSYHIPTGVQNVLIENTTGRLGNNAGYRTIQRNGGSGKHGLQFCEDGSVDLIDLRTCAVLNMAGLNTDKLTTSESPDGTKILIAYEETNENGEVGYGFSCIGILNPETGVLQMLTRNISGNRETFWGWLNNDTVVITACDAADSYCVYVYEFREQPA